MLKKKLIDGLNADDLEKFRKSDEEVRSMVSGGMGWMGERG